MKTITYMPYATLPEMYKDQKMVMSATRELAANMGFDLTKASNEQKVAIKNELAAIVNLEKEAPVRLGLIFCPTANDRVLFYTFIANIFNYR